jgi:hypothetical protein
MGLELDDDEDGAQLRPFDKTAAAREEYTLSCSLKGPRYDINGRDLPAAAPLMLRLKGDASLFELADRLNDDLLADTRGEDIGVYAHMCAPRRRACAWHAAAHASPSPRHPPFVRAPRASLRASPPPNRTPSPVPPLAQVVVRRPLALGPRRSRDLVMKSFVCRDGTRMPRTRDAGSSVESEDRLYGPFPECASDSRFPPQTERRSNRLYELGLTEGSMIEFDYNMGSTVWYGMVWCPSYPPSVCSVTEGGGVMQRPSGQ